MALDGAAIIRIPMKGRAAFNFVDVLPAFAGATRKRKPTLRPYDFNYVHSEGLSEKLVLIKAPSRGPPASKSIRLPLDR